MREEEPDTRKITKDLILKYFPTLPEHMAARLVRTFLSGVADQPRALEQYAQEDLQEQSLLFPKNQNH